MKSLWDRLRNSDADALVLIYEHFYADLLNYGVQLCNSNETAKDAINDVFLEIWDNRLKIKPVENVKAYLFACIRRKVYKSKLFNQKQNSFTEANQLFNQNVEMSYEDILVDIERTNEIRRRVEMAIQKLTDRQKELIRMKYFECLDYQEIEIKTGISIKTAYNTIYNATKILADELVGLVFFLLLCLFV